MKGINMELKSLFVWLTIITSLVSCDISCQPRPVLIKTTKYGASYQPSYVEVYRCKGHERHAPRSHACVATSKTEITVNVRHTHTPKVITSVFANHTQCTMGCVCEIWCPHKKFTMECEQDFKWDTDKCACVPDCGSTSPNKGDNDNGKTIPVSMFVVALVIEFFVVIIIAFLTVDMCKCRKHSTGVIYRTAKYVRSVSTSGNDKCHVNTKSTNRNGTGSVSILHEINPDQNNDQTTRLVI